MRLLAALVTLAAAVLLAPAANATNDTYWKYQWGSKQLHAPQAWAKSRGVGQQVAIVDSGIDRSHPDLANKVAGGVTFIGCANKPTGCGNGDWKSGGAAAGAPDPHGTHVAGTVAAVTNNSRGVAGVAPAARLLAVKSLGEVGGSFEEIAAGIRWSVNHGADVINLSLGADPGTQALTFTGVVSDVQRAIRYARSKNVVVVAAAGNEFASPLCDTPAFDEGALCVVATDPNELKASYSNLAVNPGLDAVAAPGGSGTLFCEDDIISTVPLAAENGFCEDDLGTNGYDFYAGTSMATPHVSGVAALLRAQGKSATKTIAQLESTARTPGAGTRGTYTPVYGYGIVDAAAAVARK